MAAVRPAMVRSRIRSRSSCAKAEEMLKTSTQLGVAVFICSVRLRPPLFSEPAHQIGQVLHAAA